jgi:hypothetical protein
MMMKAEQAGFEGIYFMSKQTNEPVPLKASSLKGGKHVTVKASISKRVYVRGDTAAPLSDAERLARFQNPEANK